MVKKSVVETVESLLLPVVETLGVELYDLEYVREGADWILRLFIDKESDGGIDLNDCERVSRAAEAVLDEHDPISAPYILEVSSPGVERRLRKEAHFTRYIGERVEIKLYKPFEGRKKYVGVLSGFDSGEIVLTGEDGSVLRFDRAMVSHCKLSVF